MAIETTNVVVGNNITKSTVNTAPAPAPAPATPETPVAAPVAESAPAPVVKRESVQSNQELGAAWAELAGKPRVAVIDDFVAEENGFNHGQSITGIIQQGSGADAVLYNIDQANGDRWGNTIEALGDIARRAEAGERFDAVNLSQQDWAINDSTNGVSQAIADLQTRFGIPVVVAAGNNGPAMGNSLAQTAALVVENSQLGQEGRVAGSGLGNIRSEGEFTSQATANVTARLAQLRAQGFDGQSAVRAVQLESAWEGGSLDRRPANVSMTRPMSAWAFAQTMQPAPAAVEQPALAPAPVEPGPAPAAPAAAPAYSVVAGDTLSALASQWGVSVDQIAQANGIENPDLIFVGQQLVNPAGAAPAPAPAAAPVAPAPEFGAYEIKPGDTVWDLAVVRGGMSLEQFAALNPQIADLNLIFPGQVIQLPSAALAA